MAAGGFALAPGPLGGFIPNVPDAVCFQEISMESPLYPAARALRDLVLRQPLGLVFTPAELAREPSCIHLVGVRGDQVVATLVLEPLDADTVQMRQVAVAPELQGQGVGSRLIAQAEATAREHGFRRIMAHARETALAFYERHGYAAEGDPFVEVTLPHRAVGKKL